MNLPKRGEKRILRPFLTTPKRDLEGIQDRPSASARTAKQDTAEQHSRAAQQSQLRFEHISYRSRTTAHLLGLPRSGSPGIVGQGSTNMSVDEKNAAKKEDSWHSDEAEATP